MDETVNIIVINKPMARWTLTKEKQLIKLNLRNLKNLKMVFINCILPFHFEKEIKASLQDYKYVFD